MKMKLKFSIPKKTQALLGAKLREKGIDATPSKLIEDVKKDYSYHAPSKIRAAIIADVSKGISPVKGKGRFKKYSKTYLAQIRGQMDFVTIRGVVIPIYPKKGSKLNTIPRKYGKSVSPINLRLSGELYKSLSVNSNKMFRPSQRFALIVNWNHFLADIHNRRGAGRGKVVRRMLPTGSGEQFNTTINYVLYSQLQRSVKRIVQSYS